MISLRDARAVRYICPLRLSPPSSSYCLRLLAPLACILHAVAQNTQSSTVVTQQYSLFLSFVFVLSHAFDHFSLYSQTILISLVLRHSLPTAIVQTLYFHNLYFPIIICSIVAKEFIKRSRVEICLVDIAFLCNCLYFSHLLFIHSFFYLLFLYPCLQ